MTFMGASPSGLLLVDKPSGWTSHDCVAVLRSRLPSGTKVGHTGTLDPMATGLLVILVGVCTRQQALFQGLDKTYFGQIRLGLQTDTGDVTGKTVEERSVPDSISLNQLISRLKSYIGPLSAPAPAYSAVKHKGKPLYAYARSGQNVPEKIRVTNVHDWEAISWTAPELTHRLRCSSGTYVRTLAEILGRDLGTLGTVSSLRREAVGRFNIADANPLEKLRQASREEMQRLLDLSLSNIAMKALP